MARSIGTPSSILWTAPFGLRDKNHRSQLHRIPFRNGNYVIERHPTDNSLSGAWAVFKASIHVGRKCFISCFCVTTRSLRIVAGAMTVVKRKGGLHAGPGAEKGSSLSRTSFATLAYQPSRALSRGCDGQLREPNPFLKGFISDRESEFRSPGLAHVRTCQWSEPGSEPSQVPHLHFSEAHQSPAGHNCQIPQLEGSQPHHRA